LQGPACRALLPARRLPHPGFGLVSNVEQNAGHARKVSHTRNPFQQDAQLGRSNPCYPGNPSHCGTS